MRATGLNHVSIPARDLEESARFYEELFGLERLPTPTFSNPVVWLRLGDRQLHLFEQREGAPQLQHFGVEVDDFAAFYLRLTELGIRDSATFGQVRELPSGEVQMYLRDPAGNLVEIDWPDARTLDPAIVTDLGKLADDQPQAADAEQASLFTGRPGRTG